MEIFYYSVKIEIHQRNYQSLIAKYNTSNGWYIVDITNIVNVENVENQNVGSTTEYRHLNQTIYSQSTFYIFFKEICDNTQISESLNQDPVYDLYNPKFLEKCLKKYVTYLVLFSNVFYHKRLSQNAYVQEKIKYDIPKTANTNNMLNRSSQQDTEVLINNQQISKNWKRFNNKPSTKNLFSIKIIKNLIFLKIKTMK